MFRKTLCGVAALTIALSAYGDDKIGKDTPAASFKKVKIEIDKKQGFHCKQTIKFPSSPNTKDMNVDGVSKKDFAAFSGDADIYCKGPKTLVKDGGGKFVEPRMMTGADQVLPHCIQNPGELLKEIYVYCASAKWNATDEAIGDVECKIAEFSPAGVVNDQLKKYFSVVPLPASAGSDITAYNNPKKSTSAYKVWIGKEDLLVHKIEWLLTMAVDQAKAGGPQFKMPEAIKCQWILEFSEYDENLEVEVPPEIQKSFGVKK
jgi:hypothetical protein